LKAEENPKLRDPSARQIDFRQFFPPPPDISPTSHPTPGLEVSRNGITEKKSNNPLRCARVGGSDWANVIFVLVTIIGGLLLSVHYLSGPETFRATTRWPGEFLYQRPANTESHSKIDTLASSQRDASASKPALVLQQKDNSTGQNALPQVNRPLAPPTPTSPTNNGLPFVPTTTSNPSSAASEHATAAARAASGSSQASKAGAPSVPSAPTTAEPTAKATPTPAGPSRKSSGEKQDLKPGKEISMKPGNRQIANAQKLAHVDSLRHSQENLAAKTTRNFNGPAGGAIRAFNANRAGSFGASGSGFGGRH
jgi:hypothetical protein